MVEYSEASTVVREIYDDIMTTRKTDTVNNFWKALAAQPDLLQRTWQSIKHVMAPGALDPLTKELIYMAVSATNQCGYCMASHSAGARAKGHDGRNVRRIDGRHRHGKSNQRACHWLSSTD